MTQQQTIATADCEVAFDNLSRQLYATDASIYQIEPMGVAFPRSAQQASSVIQAAIDAGVSITPRGAGTGLSGGAIGDGLIVEFSRYNRQITDVNLEARTVRTGARVPVYGTTADHVVSQELVMADGSIQSIGLAHVTLRSQRELVANLIAPH